MEWLPFRSEHQAAWIIAGVFAIFSAFLTAYQVYSHIKYNSHPHLRPHIIRIILMVPIYAVESWLGLRFTSAAVYMDVLRECYEAFVIYSFYQLLVTYLGGEKHLVATLAKKETHPHVFPFCCLPKWRMSDRFQIEFSDAEMQSLQQALQQSTATTTTAQTDEELGAAAAARGRERPPSPSVGRRNSANGESKESSDSGSGHSTSSAAASASGAGTNPSPDYSAAASSPDLLRPAGASVERPVFSAHPPIIPSTYLSPFSRPHHSDFLTHTQLGTLQYTVCKPLTALLAFILNMLDLYGDSSFEWNRGYPYIAFITNMSQIWAMYCLVLFYMCCKDELAPLKPIPKFMCVKLVVFFTFWQSVLLAILAEWGVLHATEHYTKEEVVSALQDFIVCIEMLIAALGHHYAFNWTQFHDPQAPGHVADPPLLPALFEALNVTDVYVGDVRRVTKKSFKKKGRDNRMLTREEMHEVQYASFVALQAQQQGRGDQRAAALGLPTDLHEPLVSADETTEDALSSSSSYLAPGAARLSGAGRSPSPSPAGRARVLVVHDRQSVREEFADGSVTSRTLESRQMRITPDTAVESPAESAANAAALAAAAVAQANTSAFDSIMQLDDGAQAAEAETEAEASPPSPSRATSVRIEELNDEPEDSAAQQAQPTAHEAPAHELQVDEELHAQEEKEVDWEVDSAPTRSRR